MPIDDRTRFQYEIVHQVPPLADGPVLALRLDKSFQFARDYALLRRDVVEADRPAIIDRRA